MALRWWRWGILIVTTWSTLSCTSGPIDLSDGGCSGLECDAGPSPDADADAEQEVIDPCEAIVCAGSQECRDGRCMSIDLCDGVLCTNVGEACDPRDGHCYPGGADDDGDGYTIAAGDCDDGDPAIHPDEPEVCDGVDQDCDLDVDEGFPDRDGDGFDTCGFGVPSQADCNDMEPRQSPAMREQCDGLDNDCDVEVDEELGTRNCVTACSEGLESCQGGTWVCSAPEVCECTPAGETEAQECGFCGTRTRTCDTDLQWGLWSLCADEGECDAGALASRACGNCDLGTQTRTCDTTCAWRAWDECSRGGESGVCLGCEVDVGDVSDGPYLGTGWSGRESLYGTARWIVEPLQAQVFLGVAPTVTTITFTWAAWDYQEDCSPGDGFRHGSVSIDGVDVGTIAIPTGLTFYTDAYTVPAGAAADGMLEVVITSDHAFSPSVCGGTDTRWLGIYVSMISAC